MVVTNYVYIEILTVCFHVHSFTCFINITSFTLLTRNKPKELQRFVQGQNIYNRLLGLLNSQSNVVATHRALCQVFG